MTTNTNMTVSSMADELSSQQTLMVSTHVSDADLISHPHNSDYSEKEISSSDILQQALDEADRDDPSTFAQTQRKVLHENIQHLTDHSYIHTTKLHDLSPPVDEINTQDMDDDLEASSGKVVENIQFDSVKCISTPSDDHLTTHPFPEDAYTIDKSSDVLSMVVGDTVDVLDATGLNSNTLVISENPVGSSENPVVSVSMGIPNPQYIFKLKDSAACTTTLSSSNFDISQLKLPPKQTTAPLGSVGNPIQIIQNGNSYHSTQLLTQAQLQQISHVLQRQQAQKVQNGGKSVLYDPSTNTRIVCRVVHPAELHDKSPPKEPTLTTMSRVDTSPRGRGRPKKPCGRRRDDDERLAHLSKEEREEKKKHRPRTRSGRISKPPSYMVKDYKRIHHLDFDEEPLNDSDGGYSDYQVSDEEGGRTWNKTGSLPPGVTTSKQRNYNCRSCNKAYIGRGGLSRHYRLNPTHGRMPEGEDVSTQDENSNSSLASSILSSSGGYTNNQNNSNLIPQASTRFESEAPSSSLSSQSTTMSQNDSLSERRKSKLREILRNFSEEELIEVALPKIAQRVSLWDFFQKKCDMKLDGLRIFEMLKEFEKFLLEMQRVSHQCLSPASIEEDQGKTIINISSAQIAEALSLQTGAYFVKDSSNTPLISTTLPLNHFTSQPNADLIQPHTKRKRIDHQNVEDISAKLPEQILSDAHEEAFSTVNSDLHQQDTLNATLSNTEAHSELPKGSLFDLNNSTTVTPSSLSSGCLSAVDASKPSMFFAGDAAQVLQSIQVRKVQLLGSDSHQQQQRNIESIAGNQYSLSSHFGLGEFAVGRELVVNQRQMEVDGNGAMVNARNYDSLNLGSDMGVLNSCQEIPQTIGLCSNSSLLQSLVNVSPVNNAHNIHNGDLIINGQNAPSQAEVLSSSASCLPLTDVISQNSGVIVNEDETQVCLTLSVNPDGTGLDACRELEITHNEIVPEATKPAESSQVLRHLMLPDGRVIEVWSPVESTEKPVNSQLIQNFLPGNLIILQNPDGSLQVPSNHNITLEALQTLVSAEPGQTTQTFTTV